MIEGYTVRSRTFDAGEDSEELSLVKDFLRVSHTFDDLTVIPVSMEAALEYCEACGNIAYVDCEIEATFSSIGIDGVELPLTALRAVVSVEKFVDGVFTALEPSEYSVGTLFTETTPARLYIGEEGEGEGVRHRVIYRAGLSDRITNLSNRLKMGILLAVNHFYAHRNEQNPDKTIPKSVSDLVTINRNPVL